MPSPLNGAALYAATGKALLNYQMDQTLFYQILGEVKTDIEDERDWAMLRCVASNQTVSPATALTANSLYLTPFNLPGYNGDSNNLFMGFYEPKRALRLVSSDGITFRWLEEIPISRREEYKDDDSKFYIDEATGTFYLCGLVDQQYTIKLYYKGASPDITATTSWLFPARYHLMLAEAVAMKFRDEYDYDVVNAQQADRIERRVEKSKRMMENWDASKQESEREGVDYTMEDAQRDQFYSRVVGDNNG